MQSEEPDKLGCRELRCRGHSRASRPQKANHKRASEGFDHESCVNETGIKSNLLSIKERPKRNADDAPHDATEKEQAVGLRGKPSKTREVRREAAMSFVFASWELAHG